MACFGLRICEERDPRVGHRRLGDLEAPRSPLLAGRVPLGLRWAEREFRLRLIQRSLSPEEHSSRSKYKKYINILIY